MEMAPFMLKTSSYSFSFETFRTRFWGFKLLGRGDSWGLELMVLAKIHRNGCVRVVFGHSQNNSSPLAVSVKVLYDYEAQNEDELTIKEGGSRQPSDRCSRAWQISSTMSRKTMADGGAEISRGREACFLVRCKSVACLFARQFCGSHKGDQGQGAAGKATSAKDGAGSSEGLMCFCTP